jgi:hypothetical protein
LGQPLFICTLNTNYAETQVVFISPTVTLAASQSFLETPVEVTDASGIPGPFVVQVQSFLQDAIDATNAIHATAKNTFFIILNF